VVNVFGVKKGTGRLLKYSRVKLSETNYPILNNWAYIKEIDIPYLNLIYKKYCDYKNFTSVMPIFDSEYKDINTDIIGYYKNNCLIAFSLIRLHDDKNAECLQFAWDYQEPKLRLGIESLKNECAIYKQRGFDYLYLGGDDDYKRFLNGYEILGKL
jgi:hypothetical protein